MRVKALVKLLTALLVFSAVVLTSIIGNAQIPTPTANWVNIKDPKFGAMGDGSHDDTAAIQAAIDYAFAHNLTGGLLPGRHIQDIEHDLARSARITCGRRTWTGTGYISGTTLTRHVPSERIACGW